MSIDYGMRMTKPSQLFLGPPQATIIVYLLTKTAETTPIPSLKTSQPCHGKNLVQVLQILFIEKLRPTQRPYKDISHEEYQVKTQLAYDLNSIRYVPEIVYNKVHIISIKQCKAIQNLVRIQVFRKSEPKTETTFPKN